MVDGNAPVLIFTHPMDYYEGLTSDWMDDVPNFKRVVISNDKKINGKKCKISGKNWSEPVKKIHTLSIMQTVFYFIIQPLKNILPQELNKKLIFQKFMNGLNKD
jgi:hypothetical protein